MRAKPDIAYQNKDITSKILGEKLKNKSFSVYGVKVPKIIRVLSTNLPAIQANELRIDNLFLLEDGSLALVDYESDYKHEDKIKYLDYIARTIKRCMEEEDAQIAYPLKIRMIVIYTADIEPRQTCSVLDVGCLRVQVEEAFLKQINSRETETHLKNRIDEGKALSDEEQMQLIILPLTYPGREEKQECIRRCFEMVKKVREKSDIPLCFMTYLNVVFHYGYDEFFKKCQEVGIDGIILPDLPYEESQEVKDVCYNYDVTLISMIAPTSKDRVEMIAKEAKGFIYLVSSMGVTGTRDKVQNKMATLHVADAMTDVFALFKRCNKYIDETMPWALAKEEDKQDRLATVLYNLIEGITIGASLLEPFMPETSKKILAQINAQPRAFEDMTEFGKYPSDNKVTEKPEILFARMDIKDVMEKVEEIKAAQEAETAEEKYPEVEKKPEITIDDFDKVQIQVGEVIKCEPVPKAKKLLVSQIKIGAETRQIVSGIAKYYKPEEMVGKKVAVITNLKPCKLCGVTGNDFGSRR